MGIGASIFLIAVGAILAFAIDYNVSGIDIGVVGWILMVVGGLGLVVTLVIWAPRRRQSHGTQYGQYGQYGQDHTRRL
ncbi:MAG TPA: DUF6458 family protein [Actinopolymorphaceae bacterium]|jgi:uncharacterized membrane protein|nr:DUF6458 family protein [Actinopolymorphaceae bacterium]